MFVDYANLLDDWHREMKRIAGALEIELTPQKRAPSRSSSPRICDASDTAGR